jgi:hypothetical protein
VNFGIVHRRIFEKHSSITNILGEKTELKNQFSGGLKTSFSFFQEAPGFPLFQFP